MKHVKSAQTPLILAECLKTEWFDPKPHDLGVLVNCDFDWTNMLMQISTVWFWTQTIFSWFFSRVSVIMLAVLYV